MWYWIACAVMFVLVLIRAVAEVSAFVRKHPGVKFKKKAFLQNLCTWVRIMILFVIPVLNVILFLGLFVFCTDEHYEKACWENVEV